MSRIVRSELPKPGNTINLTMRHAEPGNSTKKVLTKDTITRDIAPLVKSASESPLEDLATVANQLFQEGKLQLEQSGNIKASIKTTVIECLNSLYTVVLRLGAKTPSPGTSTVTADFTKELLAELKQQREIAVATSTSVEAVREQLLKVQDGMERHRVLDGVSYAAMAATAKTEHPYNPTPQSVHSMVVSSVDVHDTSEDVLAKIRTAVNAKTSGIRVDRLRKARDQKVVLGCQSRDELAKVLERLRTDSPTLQIEEKANRDPLVIMHSVLNINTDEDILGALKKQNTGILGAIPEGDYRASVRYRRKARNPLESHVVLQVSPPVWQSLTYVGKAHIDLQRVVVKDQSPLIQCSRCLGYGHSRKICTESVDACSHCTGPHLRNECPAFKAGERPTCRNCQSAKLEETDHNCFEGSCPIRRKWDALARARVAYC